jgi:hypothetical protein
MPKILAKKMPVDSPPPLAGGAAAPRFFFFPLAEPHQAQAGRVTVEKNGRCVPALTRKCHLS